MSVYSPKELNPTISVTGKVIYGDQQGKTIGFPTANLDVSIDPKRVKPGVYTSKCAIVTNAQTQSHAHTDQIIGLAYFGPRLVFGEKTNNFEVYLLNFSETIYGATLTVTLTHFIRAPLPFTDMDGLKKQLQKDLEISTQLAIM